MEPYPSNPPRFGQNQRANNQREDDPTPMYRRNSTLPTNNTPSYEFKPKNYNNATPMTPPSDYEMKSGEKRRGSVLVNGP